MNKTKRSILFSLLALAAGSTALGLSLYLGREQATSTAAQLDESLCPVSAKLGTLERITLQHKKERIDIQHSDNAWSIVQPISTSVNTDALHTLVETAHSIRFLHELDSENDDDKLTQFGFSPLPQWQVTLADGRMQWRIELGSSNSFDNTTYARVRLDEHAWRTGLIKNTQLAGLKQSLFQLRERRLLPVAIDTIEKMSAHFTMAHTATSTITVARVRSARTEKDPEPDSDSENNWRLLSPLQGNADVEFVQEIITSLSQAVFQSIDTEKQDLAANVQATDSMRVEIDVYAPKAYRLVLVQRQFGDQNKTLAQRASDGQSGEVESDLLSSLQHRFENLEDKHVTSFSASQVAHIQIHNLTASCSLSLVDDASGAAHWMLDAQPPQAAVYWRVAALLNGLLNMRALRVEHISNKELVTNSVSAHGTDKAHQHVIVFDSSRQALAGLYIGSSVDDYAYASDLSRQRIMQVTRSHLEQLLPTCAELAELKPKHD